MSAGAFMLPPGVSVGDYLSGRVADIDPNGAKLPEHLVRPSGIQDTPAVLVTPITAPVAQAAKGARAALESRRDVERGALTAARQAVASLEDALTQARADVALYEASTAALDQLLKEKA